MGKMDKITRVEIIDETGRVFSRWNQHVDISMQDDGQTMKVFIKRDPNGTATGDLNMKEFIKMALEEYDN